MVVSETCLYFIGMGLSGFQTCSLETVEILKKADEIFIENYTNFISEKIPHELKQVKTKFSYLKREDLEEEDVRFLDKIQGKTVAIMIPGDPFIATLHNSFRVAAIKRGYSCQVIHNTSIISAAASISGLSSYSFGRTVTCPFPENASEVPYEIIQKNKSINAHTLVLLDIQLEKNKFLTVREAIGILSNLEKEKSMKIFTSESKIIGLARLGYTEIYVEYGTPSEVSDRSNWEKIGPPQALIVCADTLSFAEEEILESLSNKYPSDGEDQ
ncbi:MAG: diphthine synthase [Candidatus Hodarchaeales archaeon]